VSEPKAFLVVAMMTSVVGDKPFSNKALKTISELKGKIVAAKNAEIKRPICPSSDKYSMMLNVCSTDKN
jgi:hypothetical protein